MTKVIKSIVKWFKRDNTKNSNENLEFSVPSNPIIIQRSHHTISRSDISKAALKVLYRIHNAGFSAYLVGGGVRDLLLGMHPKDFDVTTDAHPEKVKKLFRNSYIIGRRFRLVHVRFGADIVEVATFRSSMDEEGVRVHTKEGMLVRDNVYGTLEDDVLRRDFTVNALYYNIADFSVVDYLHGMEDLKLKQIRVIGDPAKRYQEDPARMLRAIRLAAKLDFSIEEKSALGILHYKELLVQVPPARLFDKMLKLFHSGSSFVAYQLLQQFSVFSVLFPQTVRCLDPEQKVFIEEAFRNTDARISEGKTINSAFLFAVLLWGPLCALMNEYQDKRNLKPYPALTSAIAHVIQEQVQLISIPRRYTTVMREIWMFQYFFEHTRARGIYRLFHHPRFRAAYDFLFLRAKANSKWTDLYQWWTQFQEVDEKTQEQLIKQRYGKSKSRSSKKKRSRVSK